MGHDNDDGYLWAIGGKIEGERTVADTTVYSIAEDRWYSSANGDLQAMPHGVQGAGWALHDGKIFCFGGKNDVHAGCEAHVQVYNIETDEWTLRDPMPAARSKLGKCYPVVEGRSSVLG